MNRPPRCRGAARGPRPPSAALARLVAVGAAAGLLAAGCLGGGTAPPSPGPTSGPSGSAGSGASPGASAGPTAGPFDPAAVSVVLEPYVTVPGSPLAFDAPDDGTGRLLVATKEGQILVVRDGAVDPDTMLDIAGLVSGGGEQGLLGIAVHPAFPADPRIVVHYTDVEGDTVVASYRLDAADPDRLDPASAAVILAVDQPYPNHNGGSVAFGPDGYLYVGLGDGGGGGDPQDNGERLDTLLGKVLRVDIDLIEDGEPYRVPPDNPFANVEGARPEIWLTGLRNPWRFAFDRTTGDLWIGDVGQNAWEEVDVAAAGVGGLDFGWDRMEGAHCFEPSTGCPTDGLTLPVTEYGHEDGCTIIGGGVYRGRGQPLLAGGYVFGDYCSGRLWAVSADEALIARAAGGGLEPTRVGTAGGGLAAFGEDAAGEPYAANLDGTVSRVVATAR